ncbi:unnamed protein product, partial [Iphiclides podalirius]
MKCATFKFERPGNQSPGASCSVTVLAAAVAGQRSDTLMASNFEVSRSPAPPVDISPGSFRYYPASDCVRKDGV